MNGWSVNATHEEDRSPHIVWEGGEKWDTWITLKQKIWYRHGREKTGSLIRARTPMLGSICNTIWASSCSKYLISPCTSCPGLCLASQYFLCMFWMVCSPAEPPVWLASKPAWPIQWTLGQGNRTEAGLAVCPASNSAVRHAYRPADLLAGQTAKPVSVRFPSQYKWYYKICRRWRGFACCNG